MVSGLDCVTVNVDTVDVGFSVDDLTLSIVLAKLVQVFGLELDTTDGGLSAVSGPGGLPADVGSVALAHPSGVILARS